MLVLRRKKNGGTLAIVPTSLVATRYRTRLINRIALTVDDKIVDPDIASNA